MEMDWNINDKPYKVYLQWPGKSNYVGGGGGGGGGITVTTSFKATLTNPNMDIRSILL